MCSNNVHDEKWRVQLSIETKISQTNRIFLTWHVSIDRSIDHLPGLPIRFERTFQQRFTAITHITRVRNYEELFFYTISIAKLIIGTTGFDRSLHSLVERIVNEKNKRGMRIYRNRSFQSNREWIRDGIRVEKFRRKIIESRIESHVCVSSSSSSDDKQSSTLTVDDDHHREFHCNSHCISPRIRNSREIWRLAEGDCGEAGETFEQRRQDSGPVSTRRNVDTWRLDVGIEARRRPPRRKVVTGKLSERNARYSDVGDQGGRNLWRNSSRVTRVLTLFLFFTLFLIVPVSCPRQSIDTPYN